MSLDEDFSRLTGRVYEAGSLGEEWPVVLGEIASAIGGVASVMYHLDKTLPPQNIILEATLWYSPEDRASYRDYWVARDIRMLRWADAPLGVVFAEERDAPVNEWDRCEINNDFFRPRGLSHSMGSRLFADAQRFGALSFNRELSQGPYHDREIDLFQHLVPHIIRALQLQRQLMRAETKANGLARGLDHFQLAVFLIGQEHKIIELNTAAVKLLQAANCPIALKSDRLCSKRPAVETLLKAQLAAAFVTQKQASQPPPMFRIPASDGLGWIDGMVVPLPPGEGAFGETMVLLFLSDRSAVLELHRPAIMQQFQFTAAEAEIANALVGGNSIEEISGLRNVSRETIRAQVKSIQSKTETRSQGQLVALLSRGLSAVRSFRS